jgi:hypothetical protein
MHYIQFNKVISYTEMINNITKNNSKNDSSVKTHNYEHWLTVNIGTRLD